MKNTISKLMILSLALMPLVGCEQKDQESNKTQNGLENIFGTKSALDKYLKAATKPKKPEENKTKTEVKKETEKEICLLSEKEKYQTPASKPAAKKTEIKKELKTQIIKPNTKLKAKTPSPAIQEREIELQFSDEGCGC